jgi:preprotein translocase subunit SecD
VAGGISFVIVGLFMVLAYRLPGLVATGALAIYSLLTLAALLLFPITLTLSGIAGFILSVGMAVDANILIFERMREELRWGKTLRAAIEAGFDRAWPAVFDSNVTTLITCVLLFWFGRQFGASIIQGFAVTLGIGVAISLFSAIFITRTFLRAIVGWPIVQNPLLFGFDFGEIRQPEERPRALRVGPRSAST